MRYLRFTPLGKAIAQYYYDAPETGKITPAAMAEIRARVLAAETAEPVAVKEPSVKELSRSVVLSLLPATLPELKRVLKEQNYDISPLLNFLTEAKLQGRVTSNGPVIEAQA